MIDRSQIEAEHFVFTCDVAHCHERRDVVFSNELWQGKGGAMYEEQGRGGWEELPIRGADGRVVVRLTLCPKHTCLTEHKDLFGLLGPLMFDASDDRLPTGDVTHAEG